MYRLRFAVEKMIVGVFFIFPFAFSIMTQNHWDLVTFFSQFSQVPSDLYPYLGVIFLATSYLFGSVADNVTVSSLWILGPLFKKVYKKLLKRSPKKEIDPKNGFVESFGDVIDYSDFARMLQNGSKELVNEYNEFRSKNVLFRVLALAMIVNLPFLRGWMVATHFSSGQVREISILVIILSLFFAYVYWTNRKEFVRFREPAFKLCMHPSAGRTKGTDSNEE